MSKWFIFSLIFWIVADIYVSDLNTCEDNLSCGSSDAFPCKTFKYAYENRINDLSESIYIYQKLTDTEAAANDVVLISTKSSKICGVGDYETDGYFYFIYFFFIWIVMIKHEPGG
jgi:hypothetical protein